jgi:ribose/xylose/arabinose/galactoside ABC-type transport system permease subunit
MLGISPFTMMIVKGIIILSAILIDNIRVRMLNVA